LNSDADMSVTGAEASWYEGELRLETVLPAMSPRVVCIGDAVDALGEPV
jgi:hypothetical protein